MHRDYLPVAYAPGTVGPIREDLFRLVSYDKWAESALEEFVDVVVVCFDPVGVQSCGDHGGGAGVMEEFGVFAEHTEKGRAGCDDAGFKGGGMERIESRFGAQHVNVDVGFFGVNSEGPAAGEQDGEHFGVAVCAGKGIDLLVDEPLKSLGSDLCIFETIVHPVGILYLFLCAFLIFAQGSLSVTVRLKRSFSFVVSGSTQK